jgi:hypothetical protein
LERALRLAREAETRGVTQHACPTEAMAALEILGEETLSERGRAALALLRRCVGPGELADDSG